MLQTPTAGGNIGVFIGPEGVLIVDDQFAPLSESIVSAIGEISDAEIRFLINTHIHPDHIGGNENLAELGVLIFAHDNVRLRMLEPLRIPRRGGISFPQPPEGARPVVTYTDAVTFHLNGEQVRAFLVPPAHTDGDSFVYFSGSDVLHIGDVFRTNMYPIIDVYNGGTFSGMIEALLIPTSSSRPTDAVPDLLDSTHVSAGVRDSCRLPPRRTVPFGFIRQCISRSLLGLKMAVTPHLTLRS